MLTRCPACATTFRVTPEQLKIRRGTVRCGTCAQVFNGIDQLVEKAEGQSVAVPAKGATAPGIPPTPRAPPPLPAAAPRSDPAPAPHTYAGGGAVAGNGAALDFDLSEPDATTEHLPSAAQAPADAVPPGLTFDTPPSAAPAEDPTAAPEDVLHDNPIEPIPAAPPDTALASTIEAPTPAAPRGALRWPWTAGVTLVAILLALQALIHYRVELATLSPESRPLLEALCDGLGCNVGLPARVDLVGIEASDLIPDPVEKGRLTLAATLRNRAPFAQAHPLLELTLTDNANAAVARKVLGPADYLPKDADHSHGISAGQDLLIQVALDAGALGATGYRLYLFYP